MTLVKSIVKYRLSVCAQAISVIVERQFPIEAKVRAKVMIKDSFFTPQMQAQSLNLLVGKYSNNLRQVLTLLENRG